MSEKRFYQCEGQDAPDQNGSEIPEASSEQARQIVESGSVTTKGRHTIHCLNIIGQVEGHYILPPQNKTTKYEHVIPQLVAIQEDPEIEGVIIILNTVGGDVEAGLAIAELISGLDRPTVSIVLGGGHSIGVPLAVSARKSFIVPSATMTIHPVRMNGLVLGVPQTLSYFDKMQERIVRFVQDNSNIDAESFRKLMMNTGELVMDVGTVLDGESAVKCGLIDHLGGLSDAMECLYSMIEHEKEHKSREARRRERHGGSRHERQRPERGYSEREHPVRQQRRHLVELRPSRGVYPLYARQEPGGKPPDYAYDAVPGEPTGRGRQNTPPCNNASARYENTPAARMHKNRTERVSRGGEGSC